MTNILYEYWPTPHVIISSNEVFGDIMVLAAPPPPVDPDDVNTIKYLTDLF